MWEQSARTLLHNGPNESLELSMYISMDALTLTLASFIQKYLAEAQDDIYILLEQIQIVTWEYEKMRVWQPSLGLGLNA